MTRSDAMAGGRSDVDWLIDEMERHDVPKTVQERLLALISEISQRGGLRRCEVRAALRLHVAGARVADDLPVADDATLAAVAVLNPGTLRRAQRLARAVELVSKRMPRREVSAILRGRFGVGKQEACRLIEMACDLAGDVEMS